MEKKTNCGCCENIYERLKKELEEKLEEKLRNGTAVNSIYSSSEERERAERKQKIYVGPDISEFNGKIDFSVIKKNFDFVILRCGYGKDYPGQMDEKFLYNSAECERLNIPYGVYLYSYAENTDDAVLEAKHVKRLINGRRIRCGVWYDLEDKTNPEDKEKLTDIALAFIEEMEKSGYRAGIYSSLYWLRNRFNEERIQNKRIWVAQWNSVLNYEKDSIMWQYSSDEEIDGLIGEFDMNVADERIFQ